MSSEMWEVPEMVWVEKSEKKFGTNEYVTVFTCGPYRVYELAHVSKWIVKGVVECESFLLCCDTRAEAEAVCAADRRLRFETFGARKVEGVSRSVAQTVENIMVQYPKTLKKLSE